MLKFNPRNGIVQNEKSPQVAEPAGMKEPVQSAYLLKSISNSDSEKSRSSLEASLSLFQSVTMRS